MELWTAFLLGLLGSAHCVGMCGPLVLALPGGQAGLGARLAGRLAYNLGRVLTYGLIGLCLGLLGGSLALGGAQRWVSIAIGTILLGGLLVSRTRLFRLPSATPARWLKSALAWAMRHRSPGFLVVLGALNGLLPCGLVYVACAAAAATGAAVSGLEYMVAFGLGTTPMMLALAMAGHLAPMAWRARLQQVLPLCVAAVGLLLILRGLGLGIPYLSPSLSASGASCCH